MKLVATIVLVLIGGLIGVAPGAALVVERDTSVSSEAVAQKRARTRLRVRPAYPYRRYHSLYPLPAGGDALGPNAKRECVARYVQEHRPSGTVIVPRMNCYWSG